MKKNETRKLSVSEGRGISVREWSNPENSASIVYVHGIQSHSGWAVETGEWLLENGIYKLFRGPQHRQFCQID